MTTYDVSPLEGFDPQLGVLLASLEDSRREWMENLDEPTPEAIVWQQHEGGPSIGALVLHMADCERYWFEQVVAGRPNDPELDAALMSEETDQDHGLWPHPPAKPWPWYLELLGRVSAQAREHLRGESAERVIQGRRDRFTVRWVVAHVLEHDAYHGGQLVLLHEDWKRR